MEGERRIRLVVGAVLFPLLVVLVGVVLVGVSRSFGVSDPHRVVLVGPYEYPQDCVTVLQGSEFTKGLSGRAVGHGAWFQFGYTVGGDVLGRVGPPIGFWMKDTPSALTVVWVGAGGRFLGESSMEPESLAVHYSPPGTQAAVELLGPISGGPVMLGGSC